MKEFLEKLRELRELADLGVAITITDDGWGLSVRNFLPHNSPLEENAYIEREYAGEFKFSDDGQLVDNLSPVLAKIKEDGYALGGCEFISTKYHTQPRKDQ